MMDNSVFSDLLSITASSLQVFTEPAFLYSVCQNITSSDAASSSRPAMQTRLAVAEQQRIFVHMLKDLSFLHFVHTCPCSSEVNHHLTGLIHIQTFSQKHPLHSLHFSWTSPTLSATVQVLYRVFLLLSIIYIIIFLLNQHLRKQHSLPPFFLFIFFRRNRDPSLHIKIIAIAQWNFSGTM